MTEYDVIKSPAYYANLFKNFDKDSVREKFTGSMKDLQQLREDSVALALSAGCVYQGLRNTYGRDVLTMFQGCRTFNNVVCHVQDAIRSPHTRLINELTHDINTYNKQCFPEKYSGRSVENLIVDSKGDSQESISLC